MFLIEDPLVDGADGRTLRWIGHNHEVIPVLISTIRSLNGDFEALLNHLWFNRLRKVKALRTVRVVVSR